MGIAMSTLVRAVSVIGGRRVVVALGGLYVALALGLAVMQRPGGRPLMGILILSGLVGGPGLLLLYCGIRLPTTDIHPDLYATVSAWSLIGIGVILGLLGVYELQPTTGIEEPVEATLILTALASVAGLGVGRHDAQAKTRARDAEQYSRELERQNARLESFAGMLAHELRNPLTIAQIYLQQAEPQNGAATAEVVDAHERIEEMIDILLVTVRGSDVTIDFQSVTVVNVASAAWVEVTEEEAGVDLVVESERTIQADPVHLRHLFTNLFRNSLEHGDVDVTVRVGDLTDGLYIEDDGPGIPEDARTDVVEAGFTTKADGLGLGLTFVAQLAETYTWDWTLTESTTGGARFEFTDIDRITTETDRHP